MPWLCRTFTQLLIFFPSFAFSVLGTFIVRSGALTSVHHSYVLFVGSRYAQIPTKVRLNFRSFLKPGQF